VEPALRRQVLAPVQLRSSDGQRPAAARCAAPGARLHEEHGLPVYVLVDNDPWGYYIYSVVKQGSINLAFESERMAIPKAKFIGSRARMPIPTGCRATSASSSTTKT